MFDDVWPISAARRGRLRKLGTFNGIGFGLMSFSRADASGR